jgi:hypothetical protein
MGTCKAITYSGSIRDGAAAPHIVTLGQRLLGDSSGNGSRIVSPQKAVSGELPGTRLGLVFLISR